MIIMAIDLFLDRAKFTVTLFDMVFIGVFLGGGLLNCLIYGVDNINLNHAIATCAVYILFYWIPLQYIVNYKIQLNSILKWISIGLLLSGGIGLLETIWQNVNYTLDSIFPWLTIIQESTGSVVLFGERYIRMRGTSVEPTHYMLYYGTFFPLLLFYLHNMKDSLNVSLLKLIIIISSLMVFIGTFSTAWLISSVFAFLGTIILLLIKRKGRMPLGLAKVLGLCIVSFGLIFNQLLEILQQLLYKLTPEYNSLNTNSRFSRWSIVLKDTLDLSIFLGKGPGYISESGIIGEKAGAVNYYIKILAEWGILGLITFLWFIIKHFLIVFNMKNKMRPYFLFSTLYIIVYFSSLDGFVYPTLWLFFALIKSISIQRAPLVSRS